MSSPTYYHFSNTGPVMHTSRLLPLSPISPNHVHHDTVKGGTTTTNSSIKRAFDHHHLIEQPSYRKRARRHHPFPLTIAIPARKQSSSSPTPSFRIPLKATTMTSSSINRPVLDRADSLDGAGQGFSTISMSDTPTTAKTAGMGMGVGSPPTLAPVLNMKRSNPNRLSLSLTVPSSSPPSNTTNNLPLPATSDTPTSMVSDVTRDTPLTPGPPRTPALAMAPPIARPKAVTRPSLLTLITQPSPLQANDVPPTPGAGPGPARAVRPKIRLRSSSSGTESITDSIEARSARSASLGYPANAVSSISEDSNAQFASSSSSSPPGSTYTSISTPPLMEEHPDEPYANGPVELFAGVYLGAEDSVFHWKSYAGSSKRVRILNVAQEIDDPFVTVKGKGKEKEKIDLGVYEADAQASRPVRVEYAHLLWGHGESGLADLPAGATLDQIIQSRPLSGEEEKWGFWEAIQWMEEARRDSVPVLIQSVSFSPGCLALSMVADMVSSCQCGVSRSATLAIAYIMTLAVAGLLPDVFGHLKGMQDAYDLVKGKSSAIGPNVSYVVLLVSRATT